MKRMKISLTDFSVSVYCMFAKGMLRLILLQRHGSERSSSLVTYVICSDFPERTWG